MSTVETERLLLRPWRTDDLGALTALFAEPAVWRYPLRRGLTPEESERFLDRQIEHWEVHGFGMWAAELKAEEELAGYIGLAIPEWLPEVLPAVEVGWRLARAAWGLGYATEAARAAVADGFGRVGLTEIVSFTVLANERSRAVMRRLGMTRDRAGDFEHPSLPPGHPLRQHVLYRLAAPSSGDAGRHAGHDEPTGG